MAEVSKTKELTREITYLRRELEKKLAADAIKMRDLSYQSEVTDEKGDADQATNQARRHQKVLKLMAQHNKTVSLEEIKDIAYKLSIRFRVLRLELDSILKVATVKKAFQGYLS